jgi:flagellar motility protein MotE (MotC chaperone)
MSLDYATLEALKRNHPAWRLLLADHAPLVASFLYRVFVLPNVRVMAQPELTSKLEDELFHLRGSLGEGAFPKPAAAYLEEWTQDARGWLRKYYPPGSDEAHFDLTSATEKAIAWLESLTQRAFVGTESRLMTVFDLLRQMVEGSETDPEMRIRELEKRKAEIDNEIARIRDGELAVLDETALKDRFQQVAATARELLSDFREVEQNFRMLDRSTRERIALWDGAKGELLESIFGERDTIADSDQGKSFRAFWDFLMSPERQEELSGLLGAVFALQAIRSLRPDTRLKRVHYDWLEAGEHTQRTVALLSQQLRRFLDDQAWLENRRIMQVLHEIEAHALAVREAMPQGVFMEIDDAAPSIELPMERPLFTPPLKPRIAEQIIVDGDGNVAADALFDQVVLDKERLAAHVRQALQVREQITLTELLDEHPLEQGLAELVAYLSLAGDDSKALFDETHCDTVQWCDAQGVSRSASLPRVIFNR